MKNLPVKLMILGILLISISRIGIYCQNKKNDTEFTEKKLHKKSSELKHSNVKIDSLVDDKLITSDVKIGGYYNIPEWIWVHSELTESGSNNCGISSEGVVYVVGEYDKDHVLCKYITRKKLYGTNCIDGEEFLIKKSILSQFQKKYDLNKKREIEHRKKLDLIRRTY